MRTSLALPDRMAESAGRATREGFEFLGSLGLFLHGVGTSRLRIRSVLDEMYRLGCLSIPLVLGISLFVGFISVLWIATMTGGMMLNYLGTAVSRAVLVEMGPTFTCLVLAGRLGAKIASEVGCMRVTEQIDAMVCLSLDPLAYVVKPKILACLFMAPVVFAASCASAIVSAQLIATWVYGLAPATYYNSMRIQFASSAVTFGLTKCVVFCFLIGLSGTFFGFRTSGGAAGVGRAVRATVVLSSILILAANLLITALFF